MSRRCLPQAVLLAVGLACLNPLSACAEEVERWLPLRETSLGVASGSALDFSSLVEAGPAGRQGWAQVLPDGHIGFERRRSPQRFLAASLVFLPLNGGVPDRAGSDRLVEQLQRTGYNLVRLHFVDAMLMTGRSEDFDFDPVQLDRLHYLMAALKRVGIYWLVDGLTSDNAAWGDVQPHRWVRRHRAKLDLLVSETGFGHWATLVERLWGRRNPYTGLAPLQDPAMLGMILVNEGSLGYLATIDGQRYPDVLAPLFRDWLQRRYGSDTALKTAWGEELRAGESLLTQVRLPTEVRGRRARDVDFARFVVELERRAAERMQAHVRNLGFGGLATAFDNWGFLNADITRGAMPWVDMHSYHASPTQHGQTGSRIAQTSVHADTGRYVRELSNARQWGKPFTVSEYGQPFWNRWRHESALLVPAVAAFQGWDAICQFAETSIQEDYDPSPFTRRQAIYPYAIGGDPIARAGERLAALLFLRGDVQTARGRIRLHVDPERALGRSGGWEQVPEGVSRLAFVTGIGLDFGPRPMKPVPGEWSLDLADDKPLWWRWLENQLVKAGADALATDAEPLRSAGIVDRANRTRPAARLYQSDTGELTFDSGTGRITLITPRVAAAAVRQTDPIAVGPVTLSGLSGPALVAIASLDQESIARSRRLLLWVLTDAINTDMRFHDAERTTLRTLGRWPPQVRALKATVKLTNDGAERLRVWPLNLAGKRQTLAPAIARQGTLELTLDTATLPDGPALMFELATE